MAIMQITNKEINLQNNNVSLTLVDTAYEEQTKLVGADEGITLETVVNNDNFETGLLHDIKTKQDALYTKFEAYITLIQKYAASCNFESIPSFSGYSYTFVHFGTEIYIRKPANNDLKNKIIQNELYFKERRERISAALWWLKTKWEERIRMALGDLKIAADVVNTLHGNQRIIATKEVPAIVSTGTYSTGTNLFSIGEYKKLRTPGLSGYDGNGDISVTIETGAQYEITTAASNNELIEPVTPNAASLVSSATPITTGETYLWVKARFPNGMVTSCIYGRSVVSKGLMPTELKIDHLGHRLTNVSVSFLYYTIDGTKPTAASIPLGQGSWIDVPTGAKVVRISATTKLKPEEDTTYDVDMAIMLPWSSDNGLADKTLITFYDILDQNNKYIAAIGVIPTSLAFSLDGKSLIVNGASYYDTEDWGISPIYKPYDMLTLDDLIRVYP